jgi:hypothetical protein
MRGMSNFYIISKTREISQKIKLYKPKNHKTKTHTIYGDNNRFLTIVPNTLRKVIEKDDIP